MDEENENPVVNGLVALVAVGLVIGLLAAIIALIGTRVFGITGGDGAQGNGVAAGASLYLPDPKPTELDSRLLVTLAPVPTKARPSSVPSATVSATPSATPSPTASSTVTSSSDLNAPIILSAGSSQVEAGRQLMLSGTYRQGEGSVLDIWYNANGEGWQEFNLDVNVYGGVFQAFVSTYEAGTIQWRVQDKQSGARSNEVRVQVSDPA